MVCQVEVVVVFLSGRWLRLLLVRAGRPTAAVVVPRRRARLRFRRVLRKRVPKQQQPRPFVVRVPARRASFFALRGRGSVAAVRNAC